MLRKIKVYGKLRKLLGWENGVYWADVNSTAEVGRFLVANWPHVKKHMIDQFYKVKAGGYEIGEDEIYDPIGQEISIIPIAIGAKKFFSSGIGKFIAGALIVAAVVFVPAAFPVLTIGAGTLATGSIALGIGVSLMLSGVIQMLSPQPEYPEGAGEIDPQSNFSFSGVQNVSRAGIPLSLIYGHEVFVGSVIVSNGIDTVQVKGTA
tara:strand:- start:31 stop:648 length:618 start_codon:yes stop_codon:yes gene_type:complete